MKGEWGSVKQKNMISDVKKRLEIDRESKLETFGVYLKEKKWKMSEKSWKKYSEWGTWLSGLDGSTWKKMMKKVENTS